MERGPSGPFVGAMNLAQVPYQEGAPEEVRNAPSALSAVHRALSRIFE